MITTKLIASYFLTLIVFLSIDLLWLGVIAKSFYQKLLYRFLSSKPNWTAAVIFYLLYVVGIFIFAIQPGVKEADLSHSLLMGSMFGFFTYATYDLTNLALLKEWPMKIVVVDIIWGAILTGVVSGAGYLIVNWVSGL